MTRGLGQLLRRSKHLRGEFVFCREDGSMHSQNGLKRVLPRACRRAGLREVNWHVLRHSFASQLISKGASLKAVQELLGHADITTTMRYAHLAPSALRDTVQLLESSSEDGTTLRGGHYLGTGRTTKT